MGLLAALFLEARLRGAALAPPPPTTAIGGLYHHVNQTREVGERFQPTNINFGLLPPLEVAHKKKDRKQRMADRALRDLDAWAGASVDKAA
jgi:methylenetetrahydrofolate--tRNA-(uracil-5-)-methyltransferase